MAPPASIVIPTRGRPAYLDVALASVMPQAQRSGTEVVIVNDGADAATDAVAAAHGARVVALVEATGVSAGRNAGAAATTGALLVLIDDDISAPPGWLDAILAGVAAYPGHGVFGGPIHPLLEGGGPRACGREPVPITSLDLGPEDRDAEVVWGANMALRREVLRDLGPFDEALSGCGDEEEWLSRYRARGGRIRYLARAGLEHRRVAADSTVRALSRAAYARGRAARRYDVHRGAQPSTADEMKTLAGCAWHVARRRCANGIVLGAHSAGRLREALGD